MVAALKLEQDRHRGAPVDIERVVPPEVAESGIEDSALVDLGRLAEAALEQLEVGAFHQGRISDRCRGREAGGR